VRTDRDAATVLADGFRRIRQEHDVPDGFPQPTAYFRGRRLWEEASIAAWQRRPDEAPQELRTAQAG